MEEKRQRYIPKPGTYEPAITLKDVSISYTTMQSVSIKQSFRRGNHAKKEYFEAVKGASFEIPKGQIVGITGKNGSGKSTLLRAVAGIFSANEGTIDLHGNSVSLLAIGVGFQKSLTGRENILLSGMLLGFSEEEIRKKMPRIIKFSELGAFIDKPVRTYSSGMYSKLAFSITAVLETDIMLIDEVLSVGDRHFKRKSYKRMKKMIENRKHTVMIVSHSDATLRSLCDTVIWMNDGVIKMIGDADMVLDAYEDFMEGDD
ncbi:MAG: ABC transporter ATP-binding protein [bacterium]|nr:ABC transporter ATP-binding protein [bacterium]